MADLLAEAHEHAARLQPGRILSAVPAHHIYGFIFTVLLPLLTGCDVVDIRKRLPADVRPGDLIISFPDHWRYLSQSLETLPALVGVTSTAPMPPALAHDLRAHGLARLVEIYGSSETAGIGWRDHPDLPFRLLDIWTVAEAPDPEGILLLSRGDRIVATPDLVAMADPRCCHVVGRIDGAVQVGGVNVYPARVAAALATHPLVAEIRVRPADGRLKALVVPKPADADPDSVRRTLFTWIAANLPVAERPRSITVLPRLPTGALGKAQDWAEPPDAGFDANMASQMTTSFRIKATNATSRQPSGITNCMGHHALK
jgi:4-coumarate--CoA ligase (photoactive yellow protein activation family)